VHICPQPEGRDLSRACLPRLVPPEGDPEDPGINPATPRRTADPSANILSSLPGEPHAESQFQRLPRHHRLAGF
jgi:hypothetical protein